MTQEHAINYGDSNIDRLLTAFAGKEEPDRVPYFEYFSINNDVYEAVLGRRPAGDGPTFDERIELAQRIGLDALPAMTFTWIPGYDYASASDGTEHYCGGTIRGRDDIKGIQGPPIEAKLDEMDENLAKLSSTTIGSFVYVTNFFPAVHVSMGLQNFSYALADDRAFIEEFMEINLAWSLAAVREAVKRPISFLFIDCDCAYKNGLMIRPDLFRELWLDRTRRLIEPALEKGIPVTLHSDGVMDELIPMLIELGFCAVHPVEPAANDIYEVKERFGRDICIMGNIDVAGVLPFGTPEEVRADVREHIDRLGPGGHYIVGASSHPFEGIPADNVIAMIREAHGD